VLKSNHEERKTTVSKQQNIKPPVIIPSKIQPEKEIEYPSLYQPPSQYEKPFQSYVGSDIHTKFHTPIKKIENESDIIVEKIKTISKNIEEIKNSKDIIPGEATQINK
jgi:hypothetical protein